jgi:hypothetical protein
VAVAATRSGQQARRVSAGAYVPVAVLVVAAQLNDGVEGQEPYAAVLVVAALFGLWRCRRSTALAVERVASRRAAAPVEPVGAPWRNGARGPQQGRSRGAGRVCG